MGDKPMTIEEWAVEIWDGASRGIASEVEKVLQAFREDIIRKTKEAVKPAVALQLIEFDVSIEDRRKVDQVIDKTVII